MIEETVAYRSVKGGQGCTTVALIAALKHAFEDGKQTLLLTSSIQDVAAMLNVQIVDEAISYENLEVQPIEWGITPGWERIVIDVGTSNQPFRSDATVLVTRNCFLALKRAAVRRDKYDSVLCIMEPGRPLELSDVSALFDCKVVGVDYDPGMARIIDAGLVGLRTKQTSL